MDASDGTLDFTDAFGRLNNSTRLAILRELATVQAESPFKPTVAFSKLRERVGEDDPGTFNYHLNQLRGVFVRKTDDGYRLSPDGRRFAVLVATGGMDNTLDEYPQEIDDICPVCGGQFTAVYRDGAFGVECPNDHRYATRVPRSLVNGRSSEEALAIFAKYAWSQVRFAMDGHCPSCYNEMETRIIQRGPRDTSVIRFESICHYCGELLHIPLKLLLAYHPTVVALYLPYDPQYQQRPPWQLRAITYPQTTIIDRNPLTAEVRFEREDESITFSVTDTADVTVLPNHHP